VNYKFDGESAEYTVKDAHQFVPATFENFVWFTDAELAGQIHDSVPLFTGSIPLTGILSDQVCAALDSMLKERGVLGHAVATPSPATGPLQGVQFRVVEVNVQIAEIHFPGAAPERMPLLLTATKNLIGSSYIKSQVAIQVRQACLRVYGKLGFLKAQFAAPQTSISTKAPLSPQLLWTSPSKRAMLMCFRRPTGLETAQFLQPS
jgi:hypothetical protein